MLTPRAAVQPRGQRAGGPVRPGAGLHALHLEEVQHGDRLLQGVLLHQHSAGTGGHIALSDL